MSAKLQLPSIAHGQTCSLKHKIGRRKSSRPHIRRSVWAAGKRVVKFIGYDAGEGYRSDKVLLETWADRKIQQVVSPDGMGMDGRLHPAIEASPSRNRPVFLPSMKPDDNHGGSSIPICSWPRPGAEDNARQNLENGQGPGAELFLRRTIWKGVSYTWKRLRRFAKTSKKTKEKISRRGRSAREP